MSYPPAPPQGPFNQPTRSGPAPNPSNGVGTAAVSIGGLALVCALIPPVASLGGMLGLVAVIVAVVAITRVALRKATNLVASMAALGLGGVAFVAATVLNQLLR